MPARFGAYEILYELKSGGMGAVLLGRRRGPGTFEQLVAIKTIRPEYASAPAVRAMFLDEAAILARLNHPGIATVHDFGEENGTLYMVMEYVAGIAFRDLPQAIATTVPPLVVARAIAEGARGLHAAHEARDMTGHPLGLVHRDISPDNLMLGYDGHVKVIDFGIALVKNRQAPVTEFGTVKGKPPYMSPEQVKNDPMDRRSDVFSLAVVTWELITGQPLFEGDSIYAIAIAVEQQVIAPPSRVLGVTLPAGLDAAVMAALDRDLEQRTPTAAAFAEALDEVVQASGGESLAAWADRELGARRDEHRTWLAKVVTGAGPATSTTSGTSGTTKRPGRELGQHTEVGDAGAVGAIADPVRAKAPGSAVDPIADTSIGGQDLREAVAPKKRLAPLMLVLVAVLLVAVALWLAVGGGGKHGRAGRFDAAIALVPADAGRPIPVIGIDAGTVVMVDADVVVDEPPADAPRNTGTIVRHPPRPRPDAGATGAVAPLPVGEGRVTIRSKAAETYANIVIDNGAPQSPPINKRKLGAGRHVIEFLDPRSGDVLDTQAIELADGQELTVVQR